MEHKPYKHGIHIETKLKTKSKRDYSKMKQNTKRRQTEPCKHETERKIKPTKLNKP